jgi:23S rRNA pseudouridine2604 synthase
MIASIGNSMIAGIFFRKQRCPIAPSWHHQKRWETTTMNMIRLCKRMGQLDICSRREADRWILEGRVYVNGELAVLGQSVAHDLQKDDISIKQQQQQDESNISAVVLHKPPGYVSGQPEHGHPPAIRLLRPENLWSGDNDVILPSSWKGFAPAGRLDLVSSGLMIFCSSGVLAKKLIHSDSKVDKEYIVDVEPAVQVTRLELSMNRKFVLPKPTLKLEVLREGGSFLLGDDRPLKPCPEANWLEKGKQLQLVLREGRKHHIRRACRELLGYHVDYLQRVRIGSVHLGDLPEGSWRPLSDQELNELLS